MYIVHIRCLFLDIPIFYVNIPYARHYEPQFVYLKPKILKANVIYLLVFFFCPVSIQERVIMACVWEIFFCLLSRKQIAGIVVFGPGAGPWSVWLALKQVK